MLHTDAMDALSGDGTRRLTVQMAQQMTYKAQSPQRVTEEKLYNDCCSKISACAQQGHTQAIFQIPAYSLGLPLYNIRYMRDVLAYRLQREGWKIRTRDPDAIWVGWAAQETKPAAKAGLSTRTRQAISKVRR